MNARDELASIIQHEYGNAVYGKRLSDCYTAPADAILAAGYRKPRTITDRAGLSSLPDGSILMSGDRIAQYKGAIWRVSHGMVTRVGRELEGVTPFGYFVDPIPATVLHEPGADE